VFHLVIIDTNPFIPTGKEKRGQEKEREKRGLTSIIFFVDVVVWGD